MQHKLTTLFGSAAAAVALMAPQQASAAEMLVNGQEVFANVEYDTPSDANFGFYFVAPKTTSITTWMSNIYPAYVDAAHTEEADYTMLNYDHLGTRKINVTEGQTLYFYAGFLGNYAPGSIFQILMDAALEVTQVYPAAGSQLSVTGYGGVDLWFNQLGKATSLTVSAAGASETLRIPQVPQTSISADYTTLFNTWYANGTLKGGETVTFKYEGLQTEDGTLYNGDGVYTVEFVAAPEPVVMTGSRIPEAIKSYYLPGDPEGIFSVTFSGDLGAAKAVFGYGNREGEIGDYYTETVEGKIEGNTATFDFTGKQRRPVDMVAGGVKYSICELQIVANDATGQPVYSPGLGTIGSYSYMPHYIYIEPATFAPTFRPAAGSSLTGVKTIEIELSDYDKLMYDGVKFGFADAAYTVPASEVAVSATGKVSVLKVNVPEAAQQRTDRCEVTLENLQCSDGADHSNDIRVVYNGFTLTSFELYNADGQLITDRSLYEMPEDAKIQITTSLDNPELYIEYQIVDVTDGEIVKSFYEMTYGEDAFGDPVFSATVPFAVKMKLGHTYHVEFTAWEDVWAKRYGYPELGTEFVVLEGLTPGFKFSTFQWLGVDPAEGTEITTEQRDFTFTFDGLVTVDPALSRINLGMGMTYNYAAITPVQPNDDGYASVWTVTLPEGFLEGFGIDVLNITVKAYDMDGNLIEGNFGEEENSHIYLQYPVKGAKYYDGEIELTPAADATVEELQNFSIKVPGWKVGVNYNLAQESIVLMTEDYLSVAEWTMNDMVLQSENPDDLDANTWIEFSAPKAITSPGRYILMIPAEFFIIGEQFTSFYNDEMWVNYFIEGTPEFETPDITPAPGKVESLSEFTINYPSGINMSYMGQANLILPDGTKTRLYMSQFEALYEDPDDFSLEPYAMTCDLGQTYTAEGTYRLEIDAQFFLLGSNYTFSPAWACEWTIGEGTVVGGELPYDITIDPAAGTVTELSGFTLNRNGLEITYMADGTLTLPTGEAVLIDTNKLVPVMVEGGDYWDPFLGQSYDFGETYTAPGRYVLNIPDQMFEIIDGDMDVFVPGFTVVWYIEEPTTAPEVYVLPANNEPLEELSWFSVNTYNDENIEPNWDNWELRATLTLPSGEVVEFANYQCEPTLLDPDDYWSAYIAQTFECGPYTDLGYYTLNIPAGFFHVGWDESMVDVEEITVVWSVGDTGISGAFADGAYDVYTVDGKVVFLQGAPAQLDELAAGIYVINGRKVMIRK